MKVIVDTSIWSEALRKIQTPTRASYTSELKELISEGRVVLLGSIRQEILSGIRHSDQFENLKSQLSSFEDHPITSQDYELAAELFNQCRSKGIQGSNTDFLICAVSLRNRFSIFTTDLDFKHFSKHIKIHLYQTR